MNEISCRQCGKVFRRAKRGPPGHFCSSLCKGRWHNDEPTKSSEVRCAGCGDLFVVLYKRSTKRRFCSASCRISLLKKAGLCEGCGAPVSAYAKRCRQCATAHRTREFESGAAKPCRQCGKLFVARNRGRKTAGSGSYCSRVCQTEAARTKIPASNVYVGECALCRKSFVSRYHGTLCCSESCAKRRRGLKQRERNGSGLRGCRHCGAQFRPEYGNKSRFCGEACRTEALRISRRDRRRNERARGVRFKSHKQRANRLGVPYEPIRSVKVFERDGWKCGLCGRAVDRARTVPHPRAAVLDHIVPMSKGGPHVYANVQCAHFLCNSVKADKAVGEQLLLIG